MAEYNVKLTLPDVVYHGTTMGAINSPVGLRNKLINFEFLQESRQKDFGTGFYTTIDLRQAMSWPLGKFIRFINTGVQTISPDEIPAVAKIRILPENYDDVLNVVDFRGESLDWVKYILTHRYDSRINYCRCDNHAHIVCGCMADNNTGDVISEFINSGMDITNPNHQLWFGEQITQSKEGTRLLGLELGDQIAFFDERLNRMLKFEGYYELNLTRFSGKLDNSSQYQEEWDFHEQSDLQTYDG
ncbi:MULTISPECIES: DUF3990 domain-containing protein [unclassified Paenibacillus]|uniref:DUF3990 domain-containing protein n=1 Tax=unclassified Paenibacillus TaxID=185978 RepID=UPI0030F76C1F